jgi:uncharacterized membrane protein
MSSGVFAIALATALGCGLVAGVFFAFSSFVMPALGRLPAPQAVAAMQSINVLAVTPAFMAAFLGAAGLGLAAVAVALASRGEAFAPWLLASGPLYLAGTFGVTMVCNVPLNDALARVDPASEEAAALWRRYLVSWTRWNHLRTAAALAASALAIVATAVR